MCIFYETYIDVAEFITQYHPPFGQNCVTFPVSLARQKKSAHTQMQRPFIRSYVFLKMTNKMKKGIHQKERDRQRNRARVASRFRPDGEASIQAQLWIQTSTPLPHSQNNPKKGFQESTASSADHGFMHRTLAGLTKRGVVLPRATHGPGHPDRQQPGPHRKLQPHAGPAGPARMRCCRLRCLPAEQNSLSPSPFSGTHLRSGNVLSWPAGPPSLGL